MNDHERAQQVVSEIAPILLRETLRVRGVVLIHLAGTWLASNVVMGDERKTDKLRASLFDGFMKAVRHAMKVNAKLMMEQFRAETKGP